MAEIVYILCGLTSAGCALMLLIGYRRTPSHLLLWSSLCFGALACSNILLVIDLIILPDLDFHGNLWRNIFSSIGGFLLLFGLIWELT